MFAGLGWIFAGSGVAIALILGLLCYSVRHERMCRREEEGYDYGAFKRAASPPPVPAPIPTASASASAGNGSPSLRLLEDIDRLVDGDDAGDAEGHAR